MAKMPKYKRSRGKANLKGKGMGSKVAQETKAVQESKAVEQMSNELSVTQGPTPIQEMGYSSANYDVKSLYSPGIGPGSARLPEVYVHNPEIISYGSGNIPKNKRYNEPIDVEASVVDNGSINSTVSNNASRVNLSSTSSGTSRVTNQDFSTNSSLAPGLSLTSSSQVSANNKSGWATISKDELAEWTKVNQPHAQREKNRLAARKAKKNTSNPTNKDANKSSVVRQAQEQGGLFSGTTVAGRRAYNEMKSGRGKRYTEDQQTAIDNNIKDAKALANLRRERAEKFGTKNEKGEVQYSDTAMQDQGYIDSTNKINKLQEEMTGRSGRGKLVKKNVKLDTMDRAMSGLTAVGEYYVGGTFGQSAARIGATAGAIYGLNQISGSSDY